MDQDATPSEKPRLTLAQPQSPAPAKGVPLRSIQSTRSSPQQSPILTAQNQRPTLEGVNSASARKAPISTIMPRPHSPASSLAPAADVSNEPAGPAKSLSKLALLAQQKVSASKAPKLPASKTEYLVPTANGATATTAITTSYQSLFTLTDPKRPAFIPKLDVTPLPSATATQVQSKSKLAMKVRKNGEKPMIRTPPELEEPSATSLSPILKVYHTRGLCLLPLLLSLCVMMTRCIASLPNESSQKDGMEDLGQNHLRMPGREMPLSQASHRLPLSHLTVPVQMISCSMLVVERLFLSQNISNLLTHRYQAPNLDINIHVYPFLFFIHLSRYF